METRIEVKTYNVIMRCDFCMVGEMIATREMFMSMPPQYVHKCTSCEHTKKFMGGKKYPYIEYKEIE